MSIKTFLTADDLKLAEQMFARGKRTSALKIFTVGFTTFLQNYFLKMGFLDGLAGFAIARFAAHHAFLKYLLLWEIQNKNRAEKELSADDN